MHKPPQKTLNANEIEALLRESRERQDESFREMLDPSDVQHLKNSFVHESDLFSPDIWPGTLLPDELLHQAEQQLAEAMSTQETPANPTTVSAQRLPFASAESNTPVAHQHGLSQDIIEDIELDVTLELGRAEVTIEELMQLREGSVVPLDKAAGDPIDILANGRLIARGEVVFVDDKFGVRICEVIAPH